MENSSEIKRLEDFVERLLKGYTGLKKELGKLEQELQQQQVENEQLQLQIEAMESERGELGNRVSMLIDRIETWESELEDEAYNDDLENEAEAGEMEQDVPDEIAAEAEDDDGGGGIQGNLFSATSASG